MNNSIAQNTADVNRNHADNVTSEDKMKFLVTHGLKDNMDFDDLYASSVRSSSFREIFIDPDWYSLGNFTQKKGSMFEIVKKDCLLWEADILNKIIQKGYIERIYILHSRLQMNCYFDEHGNLIKGHGVAKDALSKLSRSDYL